MTGKARGRGPADLRLPLGAATALAALAGGFLLPCGPARAAALRVQESGAPERPLLLLVVPAPPKNARGDPNPALAATVSQVLRDSQRFEVLPYDVTQPRIRRAILEHRVAVADLTDPLQPDAMRRLAHVLGARFVLRLHSEVVRTQIRTTMLLQEEAAPGTWRTLADANIDVDTVSGRRRLKQPEVVNLTADAVADRMGITSHLAARLAPAGQHARSGRDTGSPSTKPPSPSPAPPNHSAQPAQQLSTPGRPPAGPPAASGSAGAVRNPDRRESQPAHPPTAVPSFGDGAGFTPPAGAPRPAAPQTDFEAEAGRYRQSGDLANAIVSLRRAINRDPRNLDLRRQLVDAYIDRRMEDAALAEIDRARRLSPGDAGLEKLYGDTLLAKGDVPGALNAYQAATRLDPRDVRAEVALGDALLADTRFADAMAAYQAAAKADPKSPLPHRRLALAFVTRAAGDPAAYTDSLNEVNRARALMPPAGLGDYQADYVDLMHAVDNQARDLVDETRGAYDSGVQGQRPINDLVRSASGLSARAAALSDYLDKLPAPPGVDAAQADYEQAAALLMQAVGLLHDYLLGQNTHVDEALHGALVDALRDLDAGARALAPRTPAVTVATSPSGAP